AGAGDRDAGRLGGGGAAGGPPRAGPRSRGRPMPRAGELEVARAVALEAAALVRTFQSATVRVDHKHEGEPVTAADLAASELIVRRLTAAFPDDAVLSEEVPDDGARLTKARVWMVDPID